MAKKIHPYRKKPDFLLSYKEIGIDDERMRFFTGQQWQNTTKYGYNYQYLKQGICGSISVAISLTYLDMYINDETIINQPYQISNPNFANWLIMKLRIVIEPPLPGAFVKDIKRGINWFYHSDYSAIKNDLQPKRVKNKQTIINSIKDGYPVILYLNVLDRKRSPYGLHWVVAYKYVTDGSSIWYKVVDNWGNLAYIDARWVKSAVYFEYNKRAND